MITTMRWSSLRVLVMVAVLCFMTIIGALTAQQEDRRDIRTKVEVSSEKISNLEEWRRGIEATNISPRLATLESQMETNSWLLRALLGGVGALIMEMAVRIIAARNKKE